MTTTNNVATCHSLFSTFSIDIFLCTFKNPTNKLCLEKNIKKEKYYGKKIRGPNTKQKNIMINYYDHYLKRVTI